MMGFRQSGAFSYSEWYPLNAPYTEEQKLTMDTQLVAIESVFRAHHKHESDGVIRKAWWIAVWAHTDNLKETYKEDRDCRFRMDGTPYLYHLLEVAKIVADLKLDAAGITAALLHDTLEDTKLTEANIRTEMSSVVADIVLFLTEDKDRDVPSETAAANHLRKGLKSIETDLRVLIIKLADRLHNMQTLGSMKKPKQQKKAKETLDAYVPLAHVLGLGKLKRDLEDLCLRYLEPERYEAIKVALLARDTELKRQETYLYSELCELLYEMKLRQDVALNRKNIYAVEFYLHKHGGSLERIDRIKNLVKVVVQVPEQDDAFVLLRKIREKWNKLEDPRDAITHPFRNGFKALIESCITKDGNRFELQICTPEMANQNDFGITASWHYDPERPVPAKNVTSLAWLVELIPYLLAVEDNREFVADLNAELRQGDIYVTAKIPELSRERKLFLPSGATALDVAYAIDTQLGYEAVDCTINPEYLELSTPWERLTQPLKDGVRIEILTQPGAWPSEEHLNHVVTVRAKRKIRLAVAGRLVRQI